MGLGSEEPWEPQSLCSLASLTLTQCLHSPWPGPLAPTTPHRLWKKHLSMSPCVWGVPLSASPPNSPPAPSRISGPGTLPSWKPAHTGTRDQELHTRCRADASCTCFTSPMKSSGSEELETKANVFYLVLFSFCYLVSHAMYIHSSGEAYSRYIITHISASVD